MSKKITTVSDVIDRLGGNTPVSQLCGVSISAVSNWRKEGLPTRTFPVLSAALASIGEYAPQSLWNFERDARSKRHATLAPAAQIVAGMRMK